MKTIFGKAGSPLERGSLFVMIATFVVAQVAPAGANSKSLRSQLDSSVTMLHKFMEAGKAYSYKDLDKMGFPAKFRAWTTHTRDLVSREKSNGGRVHGGDIEKIREAERQLTWLLHKRNPSYDLEPLGSGKWGWTIHLFPPFMMSYPTFALARDLLSQTAVSVQQANADLILAAGMGVGAVIMEALFASMRHHTKKRLAKARSKINLDRLLVDPPGLAAN